MAQTEIRNRSWVSFVLHLHKTIMLAFEFCLFRLFLLVIIQILIWLWYSINLKKIDRNLNLSPPHHLGKVCVKNDKDHAIYLYSPGTEDGWTPEFWRDFQNQENQALIHLKMNKCQRVYTSIFHTILLKVSKFWKQIFLFSFGPKNERNYLLDFCPKNLK